MGGSEKFIKHLDGDQNGNISTKEIESFFDDKNKNIERNVKTFSEGFSSKENIQRLKQKLTAPLTLEMNDIVKKIQNGGDIKSLKPFEIRMVQLYRMVVLGDNSAQITGQWTPSVVNKDYNFLMQYIQNPNPNPNSQDQLPMDSDSNFPMPKIGQTAQQRADDILSRPRISPEEAEKTFVKDTIKDGNLDSLDYMRTGFMKTGENPKLLNEELENHILKNNKSLDVTKLNELLGNSEIEKALTELSEGNESPIKQLLSNFGYQNESNTSLDGAIIETNRLDNIIKQLKEIVASIKKEAEKQLNDGKVKQQIKQEALEKYFPGKTDLTKEENDNLDGNIDMMIEQLVQDRIITDLKGCLKTNLLKHTIQNNNTLKEDKAVNKYSDIQGVGSIGDEAMHNVGEISKEIALEGGLILVTMGIGTIVARLSVSALRTGINAYRVSRGMKVLNSTIRLGNMGKTALVSSEVLASGVGLNIGTSFGEGVFRKMMGEDFNTEEVMHNITSFENNLMSMAFAGGMRGFAMGEHKALHILKEKFNPTETIMKVVKHGMKGAEAGAINLIENDIIPFTFEGGETKDWTMDKYLKALGLVYAYSYVNKKGGKLNDKLEQFEQSGGKFVGAKINSINFKEDGTYDLVLGLPNNKSVLVNHLGQEMDVKGNPIPKQNVVLYGANNQPIKPEKQEAKPLFDQYGRILPETEGNNVNQNKNKKGKEDLRHPLEPEQRFNLFKLALEDTKIYKEFEQRLLQSMGKGEHLGESVSHSIDEHMLKERLKELATIRNHGKNIEISEHQIHEVKEKFGELAEVINDVKDIEKDIKEFLKKKEVISDKKELKTEEREIVDRIKETINQYKRNKQNTRQ